MKEYLLFVAVCAVLGLAVRFMPRTWRVRFLRSFDALFWTFSLPVLIAFLGFALVAYIASIGNFSPTNALFLTLLASFASYYGGALASTAGKLNLGSSRCPKHEGTRMVCPECERQVKGK